MSNAMSKASIGRVVRCWPANMTSVPNPDAHGGPGYAAIVAHTTDGLTCDLRVLGRVQDQDLDVTLPASPDDQPRQGHWWWPPRV